MRIKTLTNYVELGEWKLVDNIYWLRTDGIKVKNIHHGFILDFNNAAGFLIREDNSPSSPRFFGSDFNFFITEWYDLDGALSSDIEKNKRTIDNFIQLYD